MQIEPRREKRNYIPIYIILLLEAMIAKKRKKILRINQLKVNCDVMNGKKAKITFYLTKKENRT